MSTSPESRKAYRALPHVREKEAAYTKAYREKNRDRVQEAARLRYGRNIEKERERSRAKANSNPEANKKARLKYRATHPEKVRTDNAQRYAAFRTALNEFKLTHGCRDCGYKGHPAALDFDHILGVKAKEVSLCGSIAAALEEAQKCEVRCANCHRIRTFERRQIRRAAVNRPNVAKCA